MNDDNNWHDLIQRHLAGRVSAEEARTLEAALKADADLRALYLDYASLDMALGASAEAAEALQEAQVLPAPTPERNPRSLWLLLRPAAAAAAGVLLGVLTTSAVWAYAAPKIPELSRIAVPLVDPGFEELVTPIPFTTPRTLNRWNGDPHTISSEDSGVKPKQGRFMMKMLPVDHRPFSRIEQIVDVSHLVPAEGGAVEFSASAFCDGATKECKMILVLRAFTMASDEISGTTEKIDYLVTSGARKTIFIPPGSTDWHRENLRMDLPANTKTLVFAVAAVDLPEASRGAGRYLDEISATIVATESAGQQYAEIK
jgi:hypothetical protein